MEMERWVRVVTSADREKLITAHKDRNFTRRMKHCSWIPAFAGMIPSPGE